MPGWELTYVFWNGNQNEDPVASAWEMLTERSEAGWELVSVTSQPLIGRGAFDSSESYGSRYVAWFKRPKRD